MQPAPQRDKSRSTVRMVMFYVLAVVLLFGYQMVLERLNPDWAVNRQKAAEKARAKQKADADAKRAGEQGKGATPAPAAAAPGDGQAAAKARAAEAGRNPAALDAKNDPKAAVGPALTPAVPLVKARDDIALGALAGAETTLVRYVLSNTGAAVRLAELRDHYLEPPRRKDDPDVKPFPILSANPDGNKPAPSYLLRLGTLDGDKFAELPGTDLSTRVWDVVAEEGKPRSAVTFRTIALDGKLQVEKRFTVVPDKYFLDLEVRFTKLGGDLPAGLVYALDGPGYVPVEGEWYTSHYRRGLTSLAYPNKVPYLLPEEYAQTIADATNKRGKVFADTDKYRVNFAGVAVQYFASVVIPDKAQSPVAVVSHSLLGKRPEDKPWLANVGPTAVSKPLALADKPVVHNYRLFNGPKDEAMLEQPAYAEYNLVSLLVYPGFLILPTEAISKALTWLLRSLHGAFGNYGVAIIFLTVLVRLAMFYFNYKQTIAMQKLQELAPKQEEIRKKYEHDKQLQSQKLMELYRESGTNPLAGCLPALIQLPVFIGLYQSLQNSFELRHQPFFGYIRDLAAPDRLFAVGWDTIPWLGPLLGPYFNLLPVLSMVLVIVQMKIAMRATKATMTEQQKQTQQTMMVMMPVFMLFFYRVPAGLCIYILTNSVGAMVERLFLPKKPAEAQGGGAAGVGAKVPAPPRPDTWSTAVDKSPKGKAGGRKAKRR